MSITAVCTTCGKQFAAPDTFVGKRVKCKHCGTTFVITSGGGDDDEVDLSSLSQLEHSESATGVPHIPENRPKPAVGPRNETRMPANPAAGDFDVDGPAELVGRPNLLRFRYPLATEVDQFLPLVLIVAGLIWLAVEAARDDTHGVVWIKLIRFFLPVLLYRLVIFPITMAMIRKAGQTARYRMPPNPKLRGFAVYFPAFVLAVALWIVGEGEIGGLALGGIFGLIFSSMLLWLLFRLRGEEIAVSVAYGLAGFALGAGISIGAILGLNAVSSMAFAQSKALESVPVSPFGPGLSWATPPPPPVTPRVRPPAQGPLVSATPTISPILSAVDSNKISGPIDDVLSPLSRCSIIGVVHKTSDSSSTVTAWDTSNWQQIGAPVTLASQLGRPVISSDGQTLASIATFPKRLIEIHKFAAGSAVSRIDIDPSIADPELLGFCTPDRLMLWDHSSGAAAASIIHIISATNQNEICQLNLPPIEDKGTPLAVSTDANRIVIATKIGAMPTLEQFDLNTGHDLLNKIKVVEIDPTLAIAPTGLTYSNDGKRLAVMFEHDRSALLLVFDANRGTKLSEFVYPDQPFPISRDDFKGDSLAALDPLPCWALYGQGVIDAEGGNLLGQLQIDRVIAQRTLDGNRLELITAASSGQQVTVATLDAQKIADLMHPPAATQPATSPDTPQ